MHELLNILIHFFTASVFSGEVMKAEPITITLAVITSISALLKNAKFTGTPHLDFDTAAEQARKIRPSFVEQWIAENGSSGKVILAQTLKAQAYYLERAKGQSWNIMSGTIAKDIQGAISSYSIENPAHLLDYIVETWCLFCLMNYDSTRPDDFAQQFVARSKDVFGIDISKPVDVNKSGTTGSGGNIIADVVSGIGNLFTGNNSATGATGEDTGISTNNIILIVALIVIVIMIFKN